MSGGDAGPRGALAVVPIALALLTGCGAYPGGATGPMAAVATPSPAKVPTPTAPAPPTPASKAPSPTVPRTSVPPAPTSTSPGSPARPSSPRPSDDRVRGPDLSRGPSSPAARPTSPAPGMKSAPDQSEHPARTTIRIGTWSAPVVRGGQDEVDACRDAVQWAGPEIGTEDGYEMRTVVIVGHDHCGFDRFATLPVGSTVTVSGPRGNWRYEVYANYVTPGRGAPAAGLYWGDLTLQSCVGPDTGFSYLTRV
ncbi:hypothetical protein [Streptomyces sp. NPDC056464]|uniref:hypothetical protein n=1 Tax=Streptomyces sp. NPDC056464 TaxID=3345828 RepID=UPI00369CC1A0